MSQHYKYAQWGKNVSPLAYLKVMLEYFIQCHLVEKQWTANSLFTVFILSQEM